MIKIYFDNTVGKIERVMSTQKIQEEPLEMLKESFPHSTRKFQDKIKIIIKSFINRYFRDKKDSDKERI